MKHDLSRAITLLNEGAYTCVAVRGDTVYTTAERGVKPLLAWLEQGVSLVGFSVADKVVGKAAALLYVLLGAEHVHTRVVSACAAEVFRAHGIALTYDLLVDAIINRAGTGFCPMETATKDITDPADALRVIRDTLAKLK